MSWNNKVIWSEGMFLQPQHFQQQNRYHERLLENRIAPLLGYYWGFSSLELNSTALMLGKIQLTSGRGIFPDGTPFNFPEQDKAPLPLDIDVNLRDEVIVLALPVQRVSATETDSGDSQDGNLARYAIEEIEVSDNNTQNPSSACLQIGQLRLRLMRKRDATDAYTVLGVVQISERRADNQVVLHKEFVPPLLHVGSDVMLSGYLQELCGMLHQRGEELASLITQPGHRGIAEIADFLRLQTINRYEVLFKHLTKISVLHPERLYSLCIGFAGDMSAFDEKNSRRPSNYKEYHHDALALCFSSLMMELRRLLALEGISNVVPIELEERQHSIRIALVHDKGLFKSANFILAVNAQLPAEAIRVKIPVQVKAGPSEKIRDLVNLALPGIPLTPLPVAPRQLPFHAGFNYFELERKNELWKQLEHSAGLVIHIGGEFPGLALELWAIKE
ncbi:type VI secretion system protein ImpJ [Nitrosomonas sp. Nm84]|uniref:type VI secretion system baseplate subunit TssK n=1 Tax=Nitrosomonas sp. Nm84 TaxID=200124 RepID=UPI000D7597D1|nr:type VI secretion system baseplate subunit TssK [Nitrosomonas sp. Nm84]PXW82661.1 type VI secretion system protein ImpJ [Nitrosomonas sp. Nm84]